ncbi:MAG: sigma-54-dependent transcriptional regulator, partial [Candidatus Methylacidiphilales bacterium]
MKPHHTLYLIEDDRELAAGLKKMLEKQGFHPVVFHQAEEALKCLAKETPDLIISDVQLPGISGLDLVRDLSSKYPRMPIILTTAFGTTDLAIEATKAGAYDFLEKPFDPTALVALIRKAYQAFSLNVSRVALGEEKLAYHDSIIGKSPAMRDIFKQIGRLAATPLTVVVRGETGTGKELVAMALFQHSDRNQKPFLAVNCLAIPATLIESELFGHEKGAFTGAHMRRIGRFEQAQRGTLFLDEIGDLPLTTQGKLLRVLQEGVIQRLGSNMDIPIHTRVIAATHCDL